MRALEFTEPRSIRMIDVDEPGDPAAGEAIVRVHRVGVCGTDLSGYLGKMPFFSYPRIPGHELGVEVLALGDGVTNVSVGDRCSVEPYINDPESFASSRGKTNCCNQLQVLGVHRDGGMRPRFKLPARKLHASASLEFEQLALVETLAIGCHAVDRCAPETDENLLIIGAGPIGLSALEFAKLAGARVIVMDMNAGRLEFVQQKMGVPDVVQVQQGTDPTPALQKLCGDELPTVVIDATGSPASMSHCLNFAAHTGRVGYVGITTEEVHFPHPLMHAKELTLLACRNALPKDFGRIIGHIERGEIDTGPWITHRLTLDEAPERFESLTRPETGAVKAIISVDD